MLPLEALVRQVVHKFDPMRRQSVCSTHRIWKRSVTSISTRRLKQMPQWLSTLRRNEELRVRLFTSFCSCRLSAALRSLRVCFESNVLLRSWVFHVVQCSCFQFRDCSSRSEMVTIAIDFGTTFTRIAAINCSKHCVVRDEHRNTAIPSVVGFSEKGLLFGTSALKLMESNSANTIIHLVRLLDLNSNHITNHQTRRHLSHSLNKMESSKIGIPVRNCGHDYVFAPEEIIAMFMTYVKQLVEKVFVSETVERTVLIVPSCFNTAKRRMLKEAMEAAGIKVRRFISSQMAVAMRFVDMDTSVEMKKILLLSVNGGTTEASILSVHYGQVNGHEVEIKSTAGNDRLGGIDFTNALINHYVDEIKKTLRIKLNVKALSGLRRECEKAKRELIAKPTTN
ncbi:Hsp70 [Aphelenchoides besseyi]|nr:Hsp70 [Aphelenchoides besseyi]